MDRRRRPGPKRNDEDDPAAFLAAINRPGGWALVSCLRCRRLTFVKGRQVHDPSLAVQLLVLARLGPRGRALLVGQSFGRGEEAVTPAMLAADLGGVHLCDLVRHQDGAAEALDTRYGIFHSL
jgi:hypothetical protein